MRWHFLVSLKILNLSKTFNYNCALYMCCSLAFIFFINKYKIDSGIMHMDIFLVPKLDEKWTFYCREHSEGTEQKICMHEGTSREQTYYYQVLYMPLKASTSNLKKKCKLTKDTTIVYMADWDYTKLHLNNESTYESTHIVYVWWQVG